MKCFNHADREAAATCQSCGKGLCHECAAKYAPCLCSECYQKRRAQQGRQANDRKQKYMNALVQTKNQFYITLLEGAFAAIILTWLKRQLIDVRGTEGALSFFFVCMFVPFGWKFLTYLQSYMPLTIYGSFAFWASWYLVKFILACVLGIPTFIYQAFKTFSLHKKITEEKKNR